MANHFQILIVGGGNAGLSTATQLLRKNSKLQIGIIEPSDKHYYQPAWTLVGAGIFDIKKTVRNEADFIPKNTTWIKDAVIEFMPDENKLKCKTGQVISYDILIVCPGIQIDWNKIKGLKETLGKNNVSSNYSFDHAPYTWEMIKNFKGGTAIFTNPTSPIKCGGAPHKIMYLACDYWEKNGVLDKTEVHYVSGASVIFGVPEYAATLKEVVKKFNIKTHFQSNVYEIDGANKKVFFTTKQTKETLQGNFNKAIAGCYAIDESVNEGEDIKVMMSFDLCHAVPAQSAPEFIKASPIADKIIHTDMLR